MEASALEEWNMSYNPNDTNVFNTTQRVNVISSRIPLPIKYSFYLSTVILNLVTVVVAQKKLANKKGFKIYVQHMCCTHVAFILVHCVMVHFISWSHVTDRTECYIYFYCIVFLYYLLTFQVTFLSVDRWAAVRLKLRYQKMSSRRVAAMLVIMIWILSILVTIATLIGGFKANSICKFTTILDKNGTMVMAIVILICIIVTITTSFSVARALHASKTKVAPHPTPCNKPKLKTNRARMLWSRDSPSKQCESGTCVIENAIQKKINKRKDTRWTSESSFSSTELHSTIESSLSTCPRITITYAFPGLQTNRDRMPEVNRNQINQAKQKCTRLTVPLEKRSTSCHSKDMQNYVNLQQACMSKPANTEDVIGLTPKQSNPQAIRYHNVHLELTDNERSNLDQRYKTKDKTLQTQESCSNIEDKGLPKHMAIPKLTLPPLTSRSSTGLVRGSHRCEPECEHCEIKYDGEETVKKGFVKAQSGFPKNQRHPGTQEHSSRLDCMVPELDLKKRRLPTIKRKGKDYKTSHDKESYEISSNVSDSSDKRVVKSPLEMPTSGLDHNVPTAFHMPKQPSSLLIKGEIKEQNFSFRSPADRSTFPHWLFSNPYACRRRLSLPSPRRASKGHLSSQSRRSSTCIPGTKLSTAYFFNDIAKLSDTEDRSNAISQTISDDSKLGNSKAKKKGQRATAMERFSILEASSSTNSESESYLSAKPQEFCLRSTTCSSRDIYTITTSMPSQRSSKVPALDPVRKRLFVATILIATWHCIAYLPLGIYFLYAAVLYLKNGSYPCRGCWYPTEIYIIIIGPIISSVVNPIIYCWRIVKIPCCRSRAKCFRGRRKRQTRAR